MRQFTVIQPQISNIELRDVVTRINRATAFNCKTSQMDLHLRLRKLSDDIGRGKGGTMWARWTMLRLLKRNLSLYKRNQKDWTQKYILATEAEQKLNRALDRRYSATMPAINPP